MIVLAIALHLHHTFHGPPLDYVTLAAGAFASWFGVPGPGEPLLIAAGILAAKHKLDIGETLLVAFGAAAAGGIGGWLVGMKAGRAVITRRGPLHHQRERALARGEEVFRRYAGPAILVTPSWIAGIHGVRTRVFLLWNAIGAALWSLGIGLGAYFAGPAVLDAASDLGYVTVGGIGFLVAAGVGLEYARRRRLKGR